jgi:glycosyltransferase involved in cell wall biosynthesis
MSFGKPVVTSNHSSMPEVAGEAALLVNPLDVDESMGAMKRLIDEEALYADLSRKAIAQAAGFSWERAAAETLRVIEQAGSTASPS